MSRDTHGMAVVDRIAEYTEPATEARQVAWWRYERFEELGCPHEQVIRLTAESVDWHAFAALVEAGCSCELAERILSD